MAYIKFGFMRQSILGKEVAVVHSFAKGINYMTGTLGNLEKAGRWDGRRWLEIIYGMSYSYVCVSPRQVFNHSRQFETSWVITEMNGKLFKWVMPTTGIDFLAHIVSKYRHLIVMMILQYHQYFDTYTINTHPYQYNKVQMLINDIYKSYK